MAQRTGAKRFLAASGKAASAGIVPALAVVLLGGLVGCGGDSSATTATKGAPAATSATPRGSSEAEASDSGGEGVSESRDAEAEGKRSSVSEDAASVNGGKQGPKIVPPKEPREEEPTSREIAEATVANITLASPALSADAGGVALLTAAYTCDGKDSWPDLTGKNSLGAHGYSICPDHGTSETYMFALYAIPQQLSPGQSFDPGTFRQQVLAVSGNAGFLPVSYARG
jgi:hypothetical protein